MDFFGLQSPLRRLRICGTYQLQLTPRSFISLRSLEELELSNCGLTAMPAALTGVRHSLRRLDISWNDELEISQAGFEILLALCRLEWLDLRAPGKHWNADSIHHLAEFLVQGQLLHPGRRCQL